MKCLGDKVFIAWCDVYKEELVPCDVCFGRKKVHIVQGDDSTWAVACEACRHTPGLQSVRRPRCGVTECSVSGISIEGDEPEYSYSPRVYGILGIFDTPEEAQAAADESLPEAISDFEIRTANRRTEYWSQATWSAHYHRQQIKEAEKSIAWHRTQLQELKK